MEEFQTLIVAPTFTEIMCLSEAWAKRREPTTDEFRAYVEYTQHEACYIINRESGEWEMSDMSGLYDVLRHLQGTATTPPRKGKVLFKLDDVKEPMDPLPGERVTGFGLAQYPKSHREDGEEEVINAKYAQGTHLHCTIRAKNVGELEFLLSHLVQEN